MTYKVESLPQWAQRRLHQKDQQIEQLRKALTARDYNQGSLVLDPYGLPFRQNCSHLQFNIRERMWLDVHHQEENTFRISSSDCLSIHPRAANAVIVQVVKL